ncbi:MAG: ATP-binding cassette domain-containing protein, partial [Bacteroidetes bacterium]
HLQMKEVRFSYPSRPEMEILKGLNLEIEPGEKIALVGHSGAGKSTVVQLLLRFHTPTGGQILIDGQPAETYELPALRKNIGIVPQEVILFGGTIRENISYGRPGATEEEIIAAAEKAYAWEFISTFPEKLDTLVGERGIKLSGGQRQRIAIARAILKDPAILILDEATSSLDAESERVVQAALDKLMEGRTTLIIAHRLSTIRQVNRIYVIDGGEVVESGSHEELAARVDGTYHRLLNVQLQVG